MVEDPPADDDPKEGKKKKPKYIQTAMACGRETVINQE
jgi:hypothetical protein